MENNPNPAPQPQAPARTLRRNSLTIKMLFIGAIMLLLLIPGSMVMSLIKDRESMMESAQDEVARMPAFRACGFKNRAERCGTPGRHIIAFFIFNSYFCIRNKLPLWMPELCSNRWARGRGGARGY